MVAGTNAEVIAEFHANSGVVAAPYPDPPPMLLVHTTGRHSGRDHVTPMRCLPEDDHWYIFGSAHGSDRHPDWFLNLAANPDFTIEIGTETVPVRATVLDGPGRDEVFARQVARFPYFGELQARLSRVIPVVRLDRRQG